MKTTIIISFITITLIILSFIMVFIIIQMINSITNIKDEYIQSYNNLNQIDQLININNLPYGVKREFINNNLKESITIDDFSQPAEWNGKSTDIFGKPAIYLKKSNDTYEISRQYSSRVNLQQYFILTIEVDYPQNIQCFSMFLLEDMSYQNYYVIDLIPYINSQINTIIINKNDFLLEGSPNWFNINAIKFSCEPKLSDSINIKISEIKSYNAIPMCTLWFDDGLNSTYTKAFKNMQDYNMKGVLSVISSHVGYENYCNLVQLNEMYKSGWDFVNHTHNHRNMTEIDYKEVEKELSQCLSFLIENEYTRACYHFVPPYSAVDLKIIPLINKYSESIRYQYDIFNNLPALDLTKLGYQEVTSATTPEMVFKWIDEAIKNDLWLILLFHDISDPADIYTKYSEQNFQKIISYLDSKKEEIKILSLTEVLNINSIEEIFYQELPNQDELPHQTNISDDSLKLLWQDTFNSDELNTELWNITECNPYKNNELQYYQEKNIKVEDGLLKIISNNENNRYTSGEIDTQSKFSFKYGKIEIKAKLPRGKGFFPAFWLLPKDGGKYPEIDIIEYLGQSPNEIWHVYHYYNTKHQRQYIKHTGPDYSKDFHIYSFEWTPEAMVWKIDNEEIFSVYEDLPEEEMFLIINTAIGGNWPGEPDISTKFPQSLYIDYIRYYTQNRFTK